MPSKPGRICPKCRVIKYGPGCKCRKANGGWQSDEHRGGRIERGYDKHWMKLRRAKLAANPLCEVCLQKRPEVVTVATQVHHRIPFRSLRDPLRLDWDNVVSICVECHRMETAKR